MVKAFSNSEQVWILKSEDWRIFAVQLRQVVTKSPRKYNKGCRRSTAKGGFLVLTDFNYIRLRLVWYWLELWLLFFSFFLVKFRRSIYFHFVNSVVGYERAKSDFRYLQIKFAAAFPKFNSYRVSKRPWLLKQTYTSRLLQKILLNEMK